MFDDDTMILILCLYALILTISLIGCAIYIISIGVKNTRNIKKNVVYIDNVVSLLTEKIIHSNENIYLLQKTVQNLLNLTNEFNTTGFKAKNYKDYLDNKYHDNRKYCEDTIEKLPFIEKNNYSQKKIRIKY
jgi:hypothetical protein